MKSSLWKERCEQTERRQEPVFYIEKKQTERDNGKQMKNEKHREMKMISLSLSLSLFLPMLFSLSLSFPLLPSLPGHLLPELRLRERRQGERRRVQALRVVPQRPSLDPAGVGPGRRRPRRDRGVAGRERRGGRRFFAVFLRGGGFRADHEADLARGVGRDRGVGVADAPPVVFDFFGFDLEEEGEEEEEEEEGKKGE